MTLENLPTLLAAAWLTPLASFVIIRLIVKRLRHLGKFGGYISIAAIVTSTILSFIAMFGVWLPNQPLKEAAHHGDHELEGGESLDPHREGDDLEHEEP